MALQAETTFVWIIDDDVIPGRKYLEILTHVATISGAQSVRGALGSTGWLMPPPDHTSGDVMDYRDPSKMGGLYLPDDRYNITVTSLIEADLLCSQWFLETSLVRLLFRERPPTFSTGEDFMLAYSLRKYGGFGSYILPVDPADTDTWGSAVISSHTTNNKRPATSRDMVSIRNTVWRSIMARGTVPLRTQTLNPPPAPVVLVLNSLRSAVSLAELYQALKVCHMSAFQTTP